MPITKYRRAVDIPAPPNREPLDPDNIRLACELSSLAARLARASMRRGVRKFSSYEALLEAKAVGGE